MSSNPTWSAANFITESPDSGRMLNGPSMQFEKVYEGLYDTCRAAAPYRGTIGTGGVAGYICDHSEVTRSKGNKGRLVIVWERSALAGDPGVQLPADEVAFQPYDLAPRLKRHKVFQSGGALEVTNQDVRDVETLLSEPDDAKFNTLFGTMANRGETGANATWLYDKMLRGQDCFYHAAVQYVWTHHHWVMPTLSLGGVRQTPTGPLAAYCGGIAWLRQADQVRLSNGVYAITTCWLGMDFWDPDLYPLG